ncbi:MAG: hypothetical protein ABW049_04955 [Spongiibacteraceae bacterium]
MYWLDSLQWLALVVTVIAAWMVSNETRSRRLIGFWVFLLSNVLWLVWGVHAQAFALVTLQLFLAVSNIHGVIKNRR